METINKNDINLEDGEIVDFDNLKKIMTSGLEKCICKITIEEKLKCGTGFLCNIKQKGLQAFITNNHVINKEFLKKEKKLILEIVNKEKEINLELSRYKITDEYLDYTIIEIIKEDNISNFLDIDENINSNDYKNEVIFCGQYPGGNKLHYSHGKIIGKKDGLILYSLGTLGGSSGSPIILFNNLKIIGLHIGYISDENRNRTSLGLPINLIIDTMHSIKCIYRIKKEDINKNVQILNNGCYKDYYIKKEFIEKNKEIKNKIKIIINREIKTDIMKYKFNKERRLYNIYIRKRKDTRYVLYVL